MDSQSTFSTMTGTNACEKWSISEMFQYLPQHALCAGLGMVGGAAGVALAIGLAIGAQVTLFPTALFSPNPILLTLVAIMTGLGISCLLNRLGGRILPSLKKYPHERRLQIVLIFSTLTSLLQSLLFTDGL